MLVDNCAVYFNIIVLIVELAEKSVELVLGKAAELAHQELSLLHRDSVKFNVVRGNCWGWGVYCTCSL